MSLISNTGQQSGIRLKLLVVMLLLGILPLIALVAASQLTSVPMFKQSAGNEICSETQKKRDEIDAAILKDINDLRNLASECCNLHIEVQQANTVYEGMGHQQIETELVRKNAQWITGSDNELESKTMKHVENLMQRDFDGKTRVINLIITDQYGGLLGAKHQPAAFRQDKETWWRKTCNNQKGAVYISGIYDNKNTLQQCLDICVPITDSSSKKFLGVLRVVINAQWLQSLIKKIRIGESGHAHLMYSEDDRTFRSIFHDKAYIILPEAIDVSADSWLIEDNKDVSSDHETNVIRGMARLHIPENFDNESFGGKPWILVVEQDVEETFAFTSFLIRAVLPALVIIILLVIIAGILFSRALTQPLQQLLTSEKRLDLALKGAQMGLWEWDIANGKALFNERFAEMLGYRHEEISPDIKTWTAMIHTDDLSRVIRNHERHFKNHDSDYQHEYRLKTKAGDWIWIISHAKVVKRNELGKPAYIVSTILDITERKQSEKRLLARANCEQKLAQCSHSLLTNHPANTAINDALEHMLAASGADRAYIFQNFQDAQNGICARQRYEACASSVEPQISNSLLQRFAYKQGWKRWVETMSAQGIIQGGLGDFPENERATLESQGIKSLLALPIMVSGEWFGFVGFDDCTKERVWNDSDISILKTAAEMIGTYFERKRTESLTTIQRDLAVALGGISNLNKALQLCLDTALKASEMDSGGIYLRDKNTGDLKMIMHRGVSPEFAAATTVHKADSKNTKLVMKGEPVYSIYSNLDIPINQLHISENLAVIAVLPVKHEEKVIACLIVASHALEEIPTPTRNILETIATQIGGAIAHLRAEQEIQQLATMIQQAGEGVVVCDMLDIITFVNTSFAKMHGYENPDQLIKKNISILHTNEHIATNAAPFKEEVIKKGVQSGIMHHRKKDNTVFPVEITANIINDENNDPIGIIAFITDITDRLKSQKALRQSEERLELALKGANLGLWDWNLETDEAVFNERWAQMLGYEIEEIQNQAGSWKTLTHPDDVEKINRNVEAHWEGRTPEYETEHRLRSKSGEWIWVLSRGKVVQRNEDGKPLRMVGTHLDITERKKAADAIKNERDKAQRYLDVAGVILIAVEKDHTVSLINKAGCQILECEEKDIIGKDWFDTFLSPEIKNKVKKIFNQLIAGEIENTEHYENEIITAKGNRRTIAWHNSILHNKDGKIIATLGSGEDITERKIAQEKIERSERMFRGIYDNANDGICLVDADAKSFFMCNNKFCEMLGYTEVELKKMHVKDIHPQEILESIYQLIKDGIDKTNVFAKDIPAVKKNGEVFYSDISGASVPMMDKKYVIGMFRDSTEHRETDLELKRQHDFVTNVIETTPAFFIVVDLEGNTVSMNSAILAALGYQLEEVVGKPFLSTFVPKREWDQQLETFKEYTKNEKPAIYDSHLVTRDGNELLVEWHSRSIFDSRRRQKQFFAIGLNITERKKLETQLLQAQKMQTLGTLAGGVAHDYNNLLVGVLGFASIISASPDASATTRSHAAQIENTARRMADLTRQLLGFGRGGKWTTRILDVNDSIRESIKIVHGSLHREISLKLRLSPQPCCIEGDPGQILQVITNCCINAIEATGSGGAISIKTKAKFFPKPSGEVFDEWKPGDYVHIEITDNGCGMSQETLAKMFEPYFSTKSQGRGLGMAAVFGIIKNHQGWLSVDTESGTGTHMHIYLPRVEGEPQKMPTGEIALTMEKSSGKIIVIDDEQVVRQLCRNVLRKVGYNVLTAHSGNQGLRLLEKHPDCDLLLLDMVIPRPSGNKVFKKARAMYPNLKILLTSGHDDHGDIAKLIKKDAVGFLAKPFAAEELANRIRTALNADKK